MGQPVGRGSFPSNPAHVDGATGHVINGVAAARLRNLAPVALLGTARGHPEQPTELSGTVHIEDPAFVTYTASMALEDQFQQREAQRGARPTRILRPNFVAGVWCNPEAERLAKQLNRANPDQLPSIANRISNRQTDRPSRLRPRHTASGPGGAVFPGSQG